LVINYLFILVYVIFSILYMIFYGTTNNYLF